MSRLKRQDRAVSLIKYLGTIVAYVMLAVILASLAPAGRATGSPATGFLAGFSINEVGGVQVCFKRGQSDMAGVGAVMLAGIGDQLPDEVHCAHMAEHMVLMYPTSTGQSLWQLATPGHKPGTLPLCGGHTSLDSTELGFAVPLGDLNKALAMLVESLFDNKVAAGATYNSEISRSRPELTVMTTGDLAAPLNWMRMNLLKGTPYDERLFDTDLSTATPEKIRDFIKREYSPQRLRIVVIADCEEETVLQTLRSCLQTVSLGKEPARRSVRLSPPERDSFRLKAVDRPRVLLGIGLSGVSPEDYSAVLALLTTLFRNRTETPVNRLKADPVMALIDATPSVHTLIFGYGVDRSATQADLAAFGDSALASLRECMGAFSAGGPSDQDLTQGTSQVSPSLQSAIEALPPVYLEVNQMVAALTPGRMSPDDIAAAGGSGQADLKARIRDVAAKYLPSAKVSVLLVTGDTLRPLKAGPPSWLYAAGLLGLLGWIVWWSYRRKTTTAEPPR